MTLSKAWSGGMTGFAREAEKLWAGPEAPSSGAAKVCSLAFGATSESNPWPWLALATRHLCQGLTAMHP